LYFSDLPVDRRRQLIDTQQVYAAWREADADKRRRFAGGMRWARRGGREYLLRKVGKRETSLGPRSPDTEEAYRAFTDGRTTNRERLRRLTARLDEMAPVNRAMALGRFPAVAARIARRCDQAGLLGRQLFVVGTNALFAYEAMAGVRIESGLIATGDIDLLYDARQRLSLALRDDLRGGGLLGLLRQVDKSFELPGPRAYRATNQDGYLVDLIRPEARNVFARRDRAALTDLPEDMEGAAIFGLDWLINAPKVDAVVLDERGYPARIVAVDPRVFAIHKAWLAERPDRDPVKAGRDREQARAAARIATRYLRLSFDAPDLSAVPAAMRQAADDLAADGPATDAGADGDTPDW
jgi:hypothetical protein